MFPGEGQFPQDHPAPDIRFPVHPGLFYGADIGRLVKGHLLLLNPDLPVFRNLQHGIGHAVLPPVQRQAAGAGIDHIHARLLILPGPLDMGMAEDIDSSFKAGSSLQEFRIPFPFVPHPCQDPFRIGARQSAPFRHGHGIPGIERPGSDKVHGGMGHVHRHAVNLKVRPLRLGQQVFPVLRGKVPEGVIRSLHLAVGPPCRVFSLQVLQVLFLVAPDHRFLLNLPDRVHALLRPGPADAVVPRKQEAGDSFFPGVLQHRPQRGTVSVHIRNNGVFHVSSGCH